MAKISELNKKERELRNTLESLKKDYRKNQISKNDYDSEVENKQKDLEKIDKEKKSLIGKLPPIPSAPAKSSPLSEIKKEVVAERPTVEKPVKKDVKESIEKPVMGKSIMEKPTEKPKTDSVIEKPAPKIPTKKAVKKPVTKKGKTITVKEDVSAAEPVVEKPVVAKEPMPSVDDSQTRISRAIKRMVGEETDAQTIKKVFEETQKEFLTFLLEVKKNREKIQNLEALFSEVNNIRKRFNTMDFKGMTNEIYKQFERMNSLIKDNETKIEELVSNNETKIGNLEKKMGELSTSVDNIPAVDGVKRDLEAVKQKIEWVEKNSKEADMQPVMDMVSEVEKKLDSLKIRSPYIIE